MQGDEQDRGIGVVDLLGAVAVVDVPVEDRHALEPVGLLRVAGRDRDVVEQAEAHRPIDAGVVAGRAGQGEQAVGPVVGLHRDRVDRGEHRSRRQQALVERLRRDPGVGVEPERRVGARALEQLDEALVVGAQRVGHPRVPRRQDEELIPFGTRPQVVDDAGKPPHVLRVLAGVVELLRGQQDHAGERAIARVVGVRNAAAALDLLAHDDPFTLTS